MSNTSKTPFSLKRFHMPRPYIALFIYMSLRAMKMDAFLWNCVGCYKVFINVLRQNLPFPKSKVACHWLKILKRKGLHYSDTTDGLEGRVIWYYCPGRDEDTLESLLLFTLVIRLLKRWSPNNWNFPWNSILVQGKAGAWVTSAGKLISPEQILHSSTARQTEGHERTNPNKMHQW